MKMKHLIIVSLLLAILTIGAASAAQDVATDDLAASDDDSLSVDDGDAVADSGDDNVVAGDDDEEEDDEGETDFYSDDVVVSVNEDDEPLPYSPETIIAEVYAPYDATGNVTVYFDEDINPLFSGLLTDLPYVVDEDDSDFYFYQIMLSHLSSSPEQGSHYVTVEYSGDDFYDYDSEGGTIQLGEGGNNTSEYDSDSVEVSLDEEYLELAEDAVIATITAPANAMGNVTVYFGEDDEKTTVFHGELTGLTVISDDENEPDWVTYAILLRQLDPYPEAGSYYVTVEYSGDDYYDSDEDSAEVQIGDEDETGPVVINIYNFVEEGDELEYDANTTFASISLPNDALGNITVYFDDLEVPAFNEDLINLPAFVGDSGSDAIVTLTLGQLNPYPDEGMHYVYIVYSGDAKYNMTDMEGSVMLGDEEGPGYEEETGLVEIIISKYEDGDGELYYDDCPVLVEITAPRDATGNVTVYLDYGEVPVFNKDLTDLYLEDYEYDESDPYVYLIYLDDLTPYPEAGEHDIYVVYEGDAKYNGTEDEGTIMLVSEEEPEDAVDISINEYDEENEEGEIVLDSDTVFAWISAPINATGDVTVWFDGTQVFEGELTSLEYEDDEYYEEMGWRNYLLKLGDMNFVLEEGTFDVLVSYAGDDTYEGQQMDGTIKIVNENENYEAYHEVYVPIFVFIGDEEASFYVEMYSSLSNEFYVLLDGEQIGSAESWYYQYFKNLDLSEGKHTITVVYGGDSSYAPFEEDYNFTYGDIFFYVPQEVLLGYEYGDDDYSETSMQLWLPSIEGNVTVHVDGILIADGTVAELSDDEESLYVVIDLTDIGLDFGKHNYTVTYTDTDYDLTENGTFDFSYKFVMEMEFEEDVYLGDKLEFVARLPETATGTIRVEYNNKTSYINYPETDCVHISDLGLGENSITFTFLGDGWPEKSYTCTVNVGVHIVVPDEFHYGGDEVISLILPEDAQGNLTVYDDGGEVLKTAELVNGKANISLGDLPFGEYSINAAYTGDDYDVEIVGEDISVAPNLIYEKYLWINGTYSISVVSPDDVEGNLSVSIIVDEYYDYGLDEYVRERMSIYEGPANGTVVIGMPMDKLNATYYDIEVRYFEDGEQIVSESYEICIYEENPDWKLNVTFEKEICKYQGDDDEEWAILWTINNIPQHLNADYYIYVDGVFVGENEIDCDEFGYKPTRSGTIDASNLTLGTHNITIKVVPREYYSNASAEGTFEVTWIVIPELIEDDESIVFDLWDENATGTLSLKIDGADYDMVFVYDGYASIEICELALGNHTYEIEYSGDATHEKLTKSGSFIVGQLFYFINIEDGDEIPVYSFYPVFVRIADDSTGNITVTIGNLSQTKEIVNGSADFNFTGLGEGEYTVTAAYSGDDKYPAREISCHFTISGYEIIEDGDEDNSYYVLVLPSEATGRLVAFLIPDDDEYAYEFLTSADLENGTAVIYESELKELLDYGYSYVVIRYEGDYTEIDDFTAGISKDADVKITEELDMGQDANIQIDLGTATGSVIIYLNDKLYDAVELVDGKINVTIPAAELDQFNEVTFEYGGSDISSHVFMDYDEDSEQYERHIYSISVDVRDVAIPQKLDSDGTGNITLELPDDFSGNVTVYVNGTNVSTTPVGGGNVTIPLSNVPAGTHMVRVDVVGDDGSNYTYSREVYVPKPEPVMEVTALTYGNLTELIIVFPENVTGSVIVRVGGNNYVTQIEDGVATVTVDGPVAIDTDVGVVYSGNVNYNSFDKTTNANVKSLADPELTVSVDNITAGDDAVVAITTNTTFSGIVSVRIDTVAVNVTVTDGKGNATVSGLAAGNYTAVATFAMTDVFAKSVKNATFTVAAKDSGSTGAENVTIPETVSDGTMKIAMPAGATGDLLVSIDGGSYVSVPIVNGVATVDTSNLPAGQHTVAIKYDGNGAVSGFEKTANITVTPKAPASVPAKITAKDLTAYYSNVKYSVTVYGTDGKVAKNVQVVFKVNGKKVGTAKTNGKGVATISLKQVPKTYKITSEALGKSVTKKLTVKNVISLKKAKVKKSAKKLVIKATLKEGKKPLRGKKVTFKFNGKKFKAVKTNKKGVAKVTVKKKFLKKLKVGKKVKYQATYMKVTAKKSVKVKK